MNSEIERAIRYAEVRAICAGEFNFACGYEKCEYYKTDYCLGGAHPFMREGEFNRIALEALCEKLEREREPEPLSLEAQLEAMDFDIDDIKALAFLYEQHCRKNGMPYAHKPKDGGTGNE